MQRIPAGNLPFSKAVIHSCKSVMEVSGQIGLDADGNLVNGLEQQTVQTLENVKRIIEDAGWDLNDVTKVRIYLTDMRDYKTVNEIYSRYFSKGFPSRVAVAVKELPFGAALEVECTAARD